METDDILGTMKAIGYARVSTEDQAKEGVSLEAQQARIEAYCIAKGWQLAGIEVDAGISAKDTNRPGLQAVLQEVRDKRVAAIVVYKLDRLTRSIGDLLQLMTLLNKENVALVSMEESLDATTATGRLMMNLLALLSQWERELIGERTKSAMKYLKEQQRVYSRPVYGYDAEEGQLYPNEEEQAVIQEVLARREQGSSYWQIAAQLNAAGTPAKRGGQWTATTVRRILLSC
ncbi:MAG: recombinase family protein [Halobacteriota archaeon]